MLKKYKPNREIEFCPVYFNSKTKAVMNHKFSLENAFQEILYMFVVWINKASAGLLNQLSLNTLTFKLIDHYKEVLV